MLPGILVLASLLAAQKPVPHAAPATATPAQTPEFPAEPPEPEIVTLATEPAPAPTLTKPSATPTPTPAPEISKPPVIAAPVPAGTSAPAARASAAGTATPAPRPTSSSSAVATAGQFPVIRTRDWVGKKPVYAIHFSSFRKRETSERDAAALTKRLNLPAHSVAIDLGSKGTWYRTMLGEFTTPREALHVLDTLPEDVAHGAGGIYLIQGP